MTVTANPLHARGGLAASYTAPNRRPHLAIGNLAGLFGLAHDTQIAPPFANFSQLPEY